MKNIYDIVLEVVHMSFQNAPARTGCSPIDTCVTTIKLPAIIIGTFSLFSKCLTVKIQTVIVCIKTHFIDYQYQITNMALVVPAIACGPLFRFSNYCAQHAKDAAQKLCLTDQNIERVFYFCELHLFPPPQYVKIVQFSGFLKILPPMHVEGPARCPRKWPMPISVGCPHQLHKQGGVVLPGNTNWDKFSLHSSIVFPLIPNFHIRTIS